jgi:hypothetical protein
MPDRGTPHAAAGAALLLAGAAGCSAHPAPVPPSVSLSFRGNTPQVAPTVVEVICTTDDLTARNRSWSAGGTATATATGTGVVGQCAHVDCHAGACSTVPIRLIATRITAGHGRGCASLRYAFVHGSPWPAGPAGFGTSGYVSGPDRPLPPRDQTVSLTCG